jgi:high affinity sulfate transporter 1
VNEQVWRGALRNRGDLVAGLAVAAYLVPQVMAYAVVAGLPAAAGLWAAAPALVAYALLGSSRQLSMGPESTTALMTASVVGPLAVADPQRYADLAAALAVAVGLLAGLAWVLRLGFLADLLSQPILVGYLAGIAVIMIVGQLGTVTGVPLSGDQGLDELVSFLGNLDQVRLAPVLVTVATVALLGLSRARWPLIPGPLVAVVLGAVAAGLFDLEERGVELVGTVPAGLPSPTLPTVDDVGMLLWPAFGVLLVAYTDDVLTARAFALERSDERIDARREFLALGAANVAAGLLRGFPVSSSGSRTAVGAASGSRSQWHSVVAAACVIAVLLWLHQWVAEIPRACLGGIVVWAAVLLIDIAGFRRLARFRISELVLALSATVGVLVLGVLPGILVAVGLSVAELLHRVARPHDAILGHVPGLAGMHDIDDYPNAVEVRGLLVYRYDAPLIFANAADFHRRALAAVNERIPGLEWVIINVEAMVEVDFSGLEALSRLATEVRDKEIVLALARVKQDLLEPLRAFGLVDQIGADRMYPTLPVAVDAYNEWHSQRRRSADP